MRILLPLVHLLLELPRFFLICEAEPGQAILQFEGVEKCPILVV
jgi:hypothetical protein